MLGQAGININNFCILFNNKTFYFKSDIIINTLVLYEKISSGNAKNYTIILKNVNYKNYYSNNFYNLHSLINIYYFQLKLNKKKTLVFTDKCLFQNFNFFLHIHKKKEMIISFLKKNVLSFRHSLIIHNVLSNFLLGKKLKNLFLYKLDSIFLAYLINIQNDIPSFKNLKEVFNCLNNKNTLL
jgi:hypothetical protein